MSSTYGLHSGSEFADVLDPDPAYAVLPYEWDDVAPLLPEPGTEPGDVWSVDPELLLVFLRQLHPSATARMHHYCHTVQLEHLDPQVQFMPGEEGLVDVASLRAAGVETFEMVAPDAPMGAFGTLVRDGKTIELLLRVHAEFELQPKSVYYTPAQFEVRLAVDPSTRQVAFFSLEVPDRDTNVDVNVVTTDADGRSYGQADIGHVPQLGLRTKRGAPEWPKEELEAARLRLAKAFYPSARIEWKPLEEAWLAARENDRPLQVLLLFGTLDDESC